MGQIPCGPVLASKEEGELIHVHESEHCDTQYLEIDTMVQIVLFLQILSLWMPFFLYLMVEFFSLILGTFLINFLTVKLKPMQ